MCVDPSSLTVSVCACVCVYALVGVWTCVYVHPGFFFASFIRPVLHSLRPSFLASFIACVPHSLRPSFLASFIPCGPHSLRPSFIASSSLWHHISVAFTGLSVSFSCSWLRGMGSRGPRQRSVCCCERPSHSQ